MNSEFESISNKSYALNYSNVFNESWNLFSKVIGVGILAVAIYGFSSGAISMVIETITGFGALSNEFVAEIKGLQNPNDVFYELKEFYTENLGAIITTSVLSEIIMLLAFPLAGGFMLVCRETDKTGVVNIGTLFNGFKPQYWTRLMVVAILYFFISKIAFALFFFPGIYVWVAAVLACPLVMFTNLSGLESIKASFKLVNKNWVTVFRILFVASLIGLAGYLLCFIGRIVSYPFVLVTVYMLYKHIVGFQEDEISQIGEE